MPLRGVHQLPLALLCAALSGLRGCPRRRARDGAAERGHAQAVAHPRAGCGRGDLRRGLHVRGVPRLLRGPLLDRAGLREWRTSPYPRPRGLDWQRLMVVTCIPGGILGLSAAAFLPESPVWLASRGDRAEALGIFEGLRRLNGKPPRSIELEVPEPAKAQADQSELAGALGVVFGPRHLLTTCILAYVGFVLNVFYYGGMYAQPQVMTQGRGLAPGWEMVLGGPFDLIGIAVATVLAQAAPRKTVLMFTIAAAAVSISCFGYAGSLPRRTPLLEVVYQVGFFGFYWVPAMGFIVFGQLAVESYPTLVATTGGSVVFGMGRFGAMTAPLLFEGMRDVSGQWELFTYFTSVLCAMGIVLLGWKPGAQALDARKPARSV
ncbi:unnamed protein product [Prorocentrum cordatum]|uniref:Major facilitator superfamily (MFS) profile domain-containing protein n=1 Tax=Prorocentrum cordatum TaxID=2364126 RepID=A0ABN9SG25_9DINO|nr:unnamed protein product [Polarella glacialis]